MSFEEAHRWHRDLVREVPELGEDFGLERVLDAFVGFAWERVLPAEADVRRRCVEFAAWGADAEAPAEPLPLSLSIVPEFDEHIERMLAPDRPRAPWELVDGMLARVPEMRGEWPLLLIAENFADFMWAHVQADADADLLARCFAWVERLAASGDPDARNIVDVGILEAAPGYTRAGRWLGPATRALLEAADPNMVSPELGE